MASFDPLIWVSVLIGVVIAVGFFLVVIDTIRQKGRFGINVDLPNCPKCGRRVPAVRVPKSGRQFLWGGYTCSHCGTEVDKWGKEIKQKSA
jgi:hypothetical protein